MATQTDILFDRWLSGTATAEDRAELLARVEAGEADQLLQTFMEQTQVQGQFQDMSAEARQEILDTIFATAKQREEEPHLTYIDKQPKVRSMPWLRIAAAAAFIGAVVFGGIKYFQKDEQVAPITAGVINDVKPGKPGAILKLSDGRQVLLDTAGNGVLLEDFNKQDGSITVTGESVQYATLETPLGRTMQLALADGTQIWLNAGSSIRFPTSFTGNTRNVSITGEAYFEVAENKSKPFIVETRSDKIQVLGTHFNINSYTDEGNVKTTLLKGSVRVNETIIKPSEQYSAGKVATVNTELVVAWKNGVFSFDNADLQSVLKQLTRWYDIEVKYEGQIPNIKDFKGEIGRSLKLSQVLNGLTQTRVKYRIEGRTLTILE